MRTAFHLVIDRQDWLEQEMKEVCSDKVGVLPLRLMVIVKGFYQGGLLWLG